MTLFKFVSSGKNKMDVSNVSVKSTVRSRLLTKDDAIAIANRAKALNEICGITPQHFMRDAVVDELYS